MNHDLLKKNHSCWAYPSLLEEDHFFDSLMGTSEQGLTICEDANAIIVEAALPGLNPNDIEVIFEKGILWIKGNRKEEEEDKKRNYYRKASRSYSYRVDVPGDIDDSKEPIAEYEHGIMTIRVAKATGHQPRKIKVRTK